MKRCAVFVFVVCVASVTRADDIRQFSEHFIQPGQLGAWTFEPSANIADLNTDEHPGLVTIREAGKGTDIKGLLESPISLAQFPPPWEFHLGIMQNHLALKGLSEKQINYAIGLNLVVTFSDPETWPKDRSKPPADARSLQLFVVHLGNQGENYRQGIPAVRRTPLNMGDQSPEVYLFYGRGDLAPKLNGNWNFPYSWVGPDPTDAGSWSKRGGPASTMIRFRAAVVSPTLLQIGVGYGDHPGWRIRTVDVSKFGAITGIWEIGPTVSLDDWIPQTLAKDLNLDEPPVWVKSFKNRLGVLGKKDLQGQIGEIDSIFKVDRPDPRFAYYVDYAVFYGNGPKTIDHLSEDFNVPGFLADQKFYVEGNGICETHSNPGYMTVTLFGHNSSWAICPILRAGGVDFRVRKPPFEIETSFIPPGDSAPWNLWWNVGLIDGKGKFHSWQPGLKFFPGKGVRYFDVYDTEPDRVQYSKEFDFTFDPPLAELPAGDSPIGMLIQVPDEFHFRIGFRSDDGPWQFSSTYDSRDSFGPIQQFSYPCLVSFQGRGTGGRGWGTGNFPNYQKFKIDYLHFRYPRR